MKKIIIFLFLLIFAFQISAQEKYLKDENAARDLSKKFATLFAKHKISAALDELSVYWVIPKNEQVAVEEKTIKYLDLIGERFGDFVELVKLKEEKIKDFALRETYLVRYENTAIRLMLSYYKNEKGWIVNAFIWDDSMSLEFEEVRETD